MQRKLIAILYGMSCVISLGGHPSWLHEKVDGTLARGKIVDIDYTTRILNLGVESEGGPIQKKILKLTEKAKLAVIEPSSLDKLEEFKFFKIEGQSVDGQRSFKAESLTVLPDWFPEEPGFQENSAAGIFRKSRKGTVFIQAKRRMTQISNKDTVKVFQLRERNEIFALRKGQEVLFTISRLNGIEAATAVCVISTQENTSD